MNAKMNVGQIYTSTIDQNLASISKILSQLDEFESISLAQFKTILEMSSGQLVMMWESGRKTLRTQAALKIFPDYPTRILKLSLVIDAMINLLDEILDEVLVKDQKAIYILEMVRVLSIFTSALEPKFQLAITSYFNKGIAIVIPEINLPEKIKQAASFEERLRHSLQCYQSKALVMDIYVELPCIELYGQSADIEPVVRLMRIHRAMSIIQKDIVDLDRDKNNGTETPILLLANAQPDMLDKYVQALIDSLFNRAERITVDISSPLFIVSENARDLILNIRKDIEMSCRNC